MFSPPCCVVPIQLEIEFDFVEAKKFNRTIHPHKAKSQLRPLFADPGGQQRIEPRYIHNLFMTLFSLSDSSPPESNETAVFCTYRRCRRCILCLCVCICICDFSPSCVCVLCTTAAVLHTNYIKKFLFALSNYIKKVFFVFFVFASV